MAEEIDYSRGHFPASALSQRHPLRCPCSMNQWKIPHTLETKNPGGLRIQRRGKGAQTS